MCGTGLTDVGAEVAAVEVCPSGRAVSVLIGSDVAGAAQATKIVPIMDAINSVKKRWVNILVSFNEKVFLTLAS